MRILEASRSLAQTLKQHRFALAAFLIPFTIRAIPEIIAGPYPIGWDTIAFYVPNTLDWAAGKADLTTILGTAPLMYMISVPMYLMTRLNPVWIFKIMGPIIYGGMIWALYRFLRSGLRWSESMAAGSALITSLYFVTLRISWDLYRNVLGLTFILLSLPLLEGSTNRTRQLLLSVLVVMAVASDQLTGVISLILVAARMISSLKDREFNRLANLVGIAFPGMTLFFLIVLTYQTAYGTNIVQEQNLTPSLANFASSFGLLIYAYLAISPFIVIGLRRVSNFDLKNWSIFSVCAALSALLPFFGLVVASYRWSLLLDIPFCVYATAGLFALPRTNLPLRFSRFSTKHILNIFSLVIIISAALYVGLPAQRAMLYYTAFPSLIPTSMIQATVPLSDMSSLMQVLSWVVSHPNPGTALIVHQAIYGWARAYAPSLSGHLINYQYLSPLDGVAMARSAGYTSIFMIWWIKGYGWHGMVDVPDGFSVAFSDGNMAVYNYN